MIIDEVHVVENWSTFRKEYGKLWQFRSRLPPGTRMLGCSATLDNETRQVVIKNGGFRDPQILNTTTDRPELYIELRSDRSIGKSYMGLRFLIPDCLSVNDIQSRLDKTIIFFDSKQNIRIARVQIRNWLIAAGLSHQVAYRTVGVYYASITTETKERIMEDWCKPNSSCRIMLATEAMGMGVEVVGVKNVVQYDSRHITQSVSNLKVLVQRMGRAARAAGEEGHFIWLVRPWVLPSLQPNAVPYHAASRLSAVQTIVYEEDVPGLQKKSIAARRENMASIYQDLCTRCPRDVLRRFFMPTGSRLPRLPRRQNPRCCFRCQPNLTYVDKSMWTYAKFKEVKARIEQQDSIAQDRNPELKFALSPDTQLEGKPRLYGRVADALRDWRQREANKMTELYEEEYCPELILPNEELDRLAIANIQYSTELGERFVHHFHPN